ncbi:hypothetical protein CGRA01v4_02405 [Colletotrichum graminicola]|nr:hypothetical protein CGRA01v4_02405 [Colletotrichum graminicola]
MRFFLSPRLVYFGRFIINVDLAHLLPTFPSTSPSLLPLSKIKCRYTTPSCRIPNSIVTPYTRLTVSSHSLFTHSTLGLPLAHHTTLIQRRHTVEQGSRQYLTILTIPSHTSQAESKNNLDHIFTSFNHSSILSTSHPQLSLRRVKYSRKLTQISQKYRYFNFYSKKALCNPH